MNKLTEIAKANGAKCYTDCNVTLRGENICMTPDQLRATVEQVCAPLVAELVKCKEAIEYYKDYTGHQPGNGTGFSVQMVINDHRALIGDKK